MFPIMNRTRRNHYRQPLTTQLLHEVMFAIKLLGTVLSIVLFVLALVTYLNR
jgi:hypothetical protein